MDERPIEEYERFSDREIYEGLLNAYPQLSVPFEQTRQMLAVFGKTADEIIGSLKEGMPGRWTPLREYLWRRAIRHIEAESKVMVANAINN